MDITPTLNDLLAKLSEKFKFSGQDLESYMQGLLVANYEPYWDYIILDGLLNLQKPKTDYPDELIFVTYHQINELYFKLILHEIEQISNNSEIEVDFFENRLRRINRYLENLIHSFDIMIDGMDKEQFLKFRMALLPASGFQSAQFRCIEICLTPIVNLYRNYKNDELSTNALENMKFVYWAQGATEIETGHKTLTLIQFEKRYNKEFSDLIDLYKGKTILNRFLKLKEEGKSNTMLFEQMKELDTNINVNWRLAHYKSAVKFLKSKDGEAPATGGTNWQQFLPPRFQKIISFPELWSEQEKEEWGKSWIMSSIN